MCKPYHVIGDIGSAVASMISGCGHKNFPLHPFITFRDDNQLCEGMANHSRSSNIKNKTDSYYISLSKIVYISWTFGTSPEPSIEKKYVVKFDYEIYNYE